MHLALFSQNLFLICDVLAVLACVFFVQLIKPLPNFARNLKVATAAGVAASVVLYLAISHFISLKNLPWSAFLLLFVVIAVVVILGLSFRSAPTPPKSKKRKQENPPFVTKHHQVLKIGLGGAAILLIVLVEALTINDYYRYYPTIASIFSSQSQLSRLQNPTYYKNDLIRAGQGRSLEQVIRRPVTQGRVYSSPISASISHFKARQAVIYLPPAYLGNYDPNVHFPVLVLLNGTPGSPEDWIHAVGLKQTVDSFAAEHSGIAPVIIIPDHSGSFSADTECVDSSRGNVETYLTEDVPNFIKQHFNVSHSSKNWGIGGFSEGGMCAAMLTLRHQNVYQHFLDMSGEPGPRVGDTKNTIAVLYHGSRAAFLQHNIDWLLQNTKISPGVTAQFVTGQDDKEAPVARIKRTLALAKAKKLAGTLEALPSRGHTFAVWNKGFSDSLPLLSYYLGATNCTATCYRD